MVPFYKLFSLFIKVLCRPVIALSKHYHLQRHHKRDSWFLRRMAKLGTLYHRIQLEINRKILKIPTNNNAKSLPNQMAIRKGIELLYEIILYCIIISVPLYETMKYNRINNARQAVITGRIQQMNNRIDELKQHMHKRNQILNDQKIVIRDAITHDYFVFDYNLLSQIRKFNRQRLLCSKHSTNI